MRNLVWAGAICLLIAITGCRTEDPLLPTSDRGKVITIEHQYDFTPSEIDSILTDYDPFAPILLRPLYSVSVYKLNYHTIDWDGNPTTASGVVVLPDVDTVLSWPIMSYQHGTILKKSGVASQSLRSELIIGLFSASDGYVVSMPDYLGLGDGPGFHPYTHAKSEATATVDMLRATRNFCSENDLLLNNKLFLLGYSQGGHATMAAAREIQSLHSDEFSITAAAPMAGPYDVSGVQAQVITRDSAYPTPGYLPYILYAYNMVYDIYPDVREVIKDEWDSIIHPRMDGNTSISNLNVLCPPIPNTILEPAVLNEFRSNPNFVMYDILRDNNLYDWTPEFPMTMYHCRGDDQVAYENAEVALNSFHSRGASQVRLINIDDNLNHGDCAFPTLIQGKWWFDSLRIQ